MTENNFIKLPRLYVEDDLKENGGLTLAGNQAHYLSNVLRARSGDALRLFNGRDGEWRGTIDSLGKKEISIRIETMLKAQPLAPRAVRLFFAPIKKARMDFLIEKAVELGATHLHPVLTQNTEVRLINENRIRVQIIEATEQCERLDIPELLPLQKLFDVLPNTPLLACIERADARPLPGSLPPANEPVAFLIGPEGGFSVEEKERLFAMKNVTPASLGPRVLRSETAALAALCSIQNNCHPRQ